MLSQWACEGARATARGVAARRVLLNVGKGPLPRRKRKEATGWRRIARGRAAVKVVGFAPLAEAAGLLLPMRAPPRVFGPWLQRFPQHRCGVSAASPLGSVRMMLEHHTRAPAARSSTGARSRAPPVGPRATTAAARTVADASREKARTSFFNVNVHSNCCEYTRNPVLFMYDPFMPMYDLSQFMLMLNLNVFSNQGLPLEEERKA